MNRRFTLAYFSGTGSTKAVCDCFDKQLACMGIDCNKISISNHPPADVREGDFLVIMSPVYGFRLAPAVEEWVRGLAPVDGKTPVAVISVSGGGEMGPNTACRLYCKRILIQKGYQVIYEQMIVMPSNIAVQAERLNAALIAVLPEKVSKITNDILSGRERLTKPSLLAKLCALLGKAGGGAFKSFASKYIKVTEMCQGCGICARNCPKNNITMEKGKPVFGQNCTMCLGCIYGCPAEAFAPGKMKFVVIKSGYNLDKMATQGNPEPDEEDYKPYRGLIWKGVVEYLGNDRSE